MDIGTPKLVALCLALSAGVGTRGPVKYADVSISKVRKGYWSVSFTYPRFQPVTAVASLANLEIATFAQTNVSEWVTQTTKDMEKPENAWVAEFTPTVVTAEPDLISLEVTQYADTGGAHPNTSQYTLNYGFFGNAAQPLKLRDLFKHGVRPIGLISRLVIAKLREKGAAWVVEGTVKALDAKQTEQFVIKHDRLTYVFSPYEMGSYAEGTYEVDVPFVELAGKLDPRGPLKSLLGKSKLAGRRPA